MNEVADTIFTLLIFCSLPSRVFPSLRELKVLTPKTVCGVSPVIFRTPPLARSSIVTTALPLSANTTSLPAIVKVPSKLVAEVATPVTLPIKVSALISEPVPPINLCEPNVILPSIVNCSNVPSLVILVCCESVILPVKDSALITEPIPPLIAFVPKFTLPFKVRELSVADLSKELMIVLLSLARIIPFKLPFTSPSKVDLILGTVNFCKTGLYSSEVLTNDCLSPWPVVNVRCLSELDASSRETCVTRGTISALPSKLTLPIFTAVFKIVAVAALPVVS